MPLEEKNGAENLLKVKSNSFILMVGHDQEVDVHRLDGATLLSLRNRALELASKNGDSVLVGRLVGLDENNVPIWKSFARVVTMKSDPFSVEAFESWVNGLTRRLNSVANDAADRIMKRSSTAIDIDWVNASSERRSQSIARISSNVGSGLTGDEITRQRRAINGISRRVITSTERAAKRQPGIAGTQAVVTELPAVRLARQMSQHHEFFVKDRYGNVSQSMTEQAKRIVADGLAQGRRSREIARELEINLRQSLRMRNYWNIVSSNHVSRARNYSHGAMMQAAGILRYKYEAVLDEATTETCLMLHGREMMVGDCMALQEKLLASNKPSSLERYQSFATKDGDAIMVDMPDGSRRTIGEIVTPGAGTGSPGRYRNVSSSSDLVSAAVGFPPLHHACRTTMVAVV